MRSTSFWILTVLTLLLFTSSYMGESTLPKPSKEDPRWTEVQNLEKKGLYKSAWEVVNNIYAEAEQQKDFETQYKALCYQLKYSQKIDEESEEIAIARLQKIADSNRLPISALAHSLLAQTYWSYFTQHSWQILQRTEIENNTEKDIALWGAKKFISQVDEHLQASLKNKSELKAIKLTDLNPEILSNTENLDRTPRLYDLLAHSAISFYTDSRAEVTKGRDYYQIAEASYYDLGEQFKDMKVSSNDELSFTLRAVQLFQELLKEQKSQSTSWLHTDLKRLQFVKQHSSYKKAESSMDDEAYFDALSAAVETYGSHPVMAEYEAEMALLLENDGRKNKHGSQPEKADRLKEAKAICEAVMSKYPDSHGAAQCLNISARITQQTARIKVESELIPNRPGLIQVEYQNIDELWIRVVPITSDAGRWNRYSDETISELLEVEAAHEFSMDLINPGDYQLHSSEFMLPALQAGYYALLTSADKFFLPATSKLEWCGVQVTDIMAITRKDERGGEMIRVRNRATGEALPEAEVSLIYTDYSSGNRRERSEKVKGPLSCDAQGEVYFPFIKNGYGQRYEVSYKGQKHFVQSSLQEVRRTHSNTLVNLFLDRAIYRPGQTVYFKAIAVTSNGTKSAVAAGFDLHLELKDVNYQTVSDMRLKTNEYGTCQGSFTIPSDGLTGSMNIMTAQGGISFSVEEYKRPKFEVTMDPVDEEFKLNETVTVTGIAKGYNGAAVSGATVSYTVNRRPEIKWYWGWWRRPSISSAEVVMKAGETTTDDQGRFSITFESTGDKTADPKDISYFNFSIAADVTDINGETRSGDTNVRISDKSVMLSIDIDEEVERSQWTDVALSATNINGQDITQNGEWELRALAKTDRVKIERKWQDAQYMGISERDFGMLFPNMDFDPKAAFKDKSGRLVESGTWSTETGLLSKKIFSKLENGSYTLSLKSTGADGKEYSTEKKFTVYALKKGPAVFADGLKILTDKKEYRPGDKASILISSLWSDLPVLVYTEHEGKVQLSKELKLNKEQTLIEVPITAAHQSGLRIHVAGLKENRYYTMTKEINVEKVDQLLDVTLETFRDKMLPGSKEEWRLKVSNRNGDKNISEVLVSMYDASLDQFRSHDWNFNPYRKTRAELRSRTHNGGVSSCNGRAWRDNLPSSPYLNLPGINRFGYTSVLFSYGHYEYEMVEESEYMLDANDAVMVRSARSDAPAVGGLVSLDNAGNSAVQSFKWEEGSADKKPAEELTSESKSPPLQIRSNFEETAFFFPQLLTDAQGNLIFSFTLPESLTTWKFKALAHTKELQIGSTSQEVISQKELMVVPNPPRFLRKGDLIYLSTKVTNLSDQSLSGHVRLELLDAMTNSPISTVLIKDEESKAFSLATDESKAYSWHIEVPQTYEAVTYRFIAESETHNDGEEAILPVLSNRMLVHESMPFSIIKERQKEFDFTRMAEASISSTLTNHALTMEFTGNPVWYAVQAMPYMMEYPHDCSEQIFTRYYANALSASIMDKRPLLREVINKWKTLSPKSFLSNLEKNQELKYVLLEETPWVMEAHNETERQKRLSLLLDINHMSNAQSKALNQLKKNQLSSGAWPWFNGMRESLYITQHIVSGMGHLKKLGAAPDQRVDQMIRSAVNYMDAEHSRRFDELKRLHADYLNEDHTGQFQIQFLYARSFFPDIPVQKRHKEAHEYYAKQAREYWLSDNDYVQAMNALAQYRMGEEKKAKAIMASLKEKSIMNDELGMYWKDYSSSWHWHQPGVEKHAIMVEAFNDIMDDQEAVYGL